MQTFTHDRLTVALQDVGEGPGVVFIHNGGTSSTIWRHQVADLSADHRVIALDLPARRDVRLDVVDALGREVALLHDGTLEPGSTSFGFDASGLPSGIYFARLRYDGRLITRRLVVTR